MCKFCSDDCTRKNIRDQIIEGLLDGDTVEHLLQEKELNLDKAITTCRAQEAARSSGQRWPPPHVNLCTSRPSSDTPTLRDSRSLNHAQGVELASIRVVDNNVQHTTSHATIARKLATSRGYAEAANTSLVRPTTEPSLPYPTWSAGRLHNTIHGNCEALPSTEI